jgi:hypothetical protein
MATGVPQHVRMRLELKACYLTQPFNHLSEAVLCKRRAAFGYEHELPVVGLTSELSQCPQLVTPNRVNGGNAAFDSTDMHSCRSAPIASAGATDVSKSSDDKALATAASTDQDAIQHATDAVAASQNSADKALTVGRPQRFCFPF